MPARRRARRRHARARRRMQWEDLGPVSQDIVLGKPVYALDWIAEAGDDEVEAHRRCQVIADYKRRRGAQVEAEAFQAFADALRAGLLTKGERNE